MEARLWEVAQSRRMLGYVKQDMRVARTHMAVMEVVRGDTTLYIFYRCR